MSLGWAVCQFRQDHNGKKPPNSQLFALIQVQLFSFTCNKNSDNFLCPYGGSSSCNNLKFHHPLPPKKSNLKSKASYLLFPLSQSKCKFWICLYVFKHKLENETLKNWKKEEHRIWKIRIETATDLVIDSILRSEKLKIGSSRRRCSVLQRWVKKKKKNGTDREPFQASTSLKVRQGLCWPFRLFAGRELKLFLLRDKVKRIIIKQLHWNAANNTAFCFPGMV